MVSTSAKLNHLELLAAHSIMAKSKTTSNNPQIMYFTLVYQVDTRIRFFVLAYKK